MKILKSLFESKPDYKELYIKSIEECTFWVKESTKFADKHTASMIENCKLKMEITELKSELFKIKMEELKAKI